MLLLPAASLRANTPVGLGKHEERDESRRVGVKRGSGG